MFEDEPGAMGKLDRMPPARDREAADDNAVDGFVTRRQLIAPRDVVHGPRGQDFHLRVTREPFRDVSRVQFSSAADVRAVALNNNRQLH